jgi:CRISPR-associated protein Cas2
MSNRRLWLVSFDVADDTRRRILVDELLGYFDRVQGSVFEGYLNYDHAMTLFQRLIHQLDLDEDKLTFFPICHWCETRLKIIGLGHHSSDAQFILI